MKYKLTNETKVVDGVTVYRIQATVDFSDVKKGDLGGFVEKEDNLSQVGSAWVYDDAVVYGNAKVFEFAKVHDNAKVIDEAKVYGHALVANNAKVSENASVADHAVVKDGTYIHGNASVVGHAEVLGSTELLDHVLAFGYAKVKVDVALGGNSELHNELVLG